MTLIVLEGLNGVGKSAHAVGLSEALGVPILRPFRQAPDVHLGRSGDRQSMLRAHGIPVNTFVDDIYTADFVASTGISAVLDRSIGSAIAYGTLYGDVKSSRAATRLLVLWHELLKPYAGPILYVHMTANHETRQRRCQGRWAPSDEQAHHLSVWFHRVYHEHIKVPKMELDTSDVLSAFDGVKRILDRMR